MSEADMFLMGFMVCVGLCAGAFIWFMCKQYSPPKFPPPPARNVYEDYECPKFEVINTTSHPCTVTVTSMGPSEYHITLSDDQDRKDDMKDIIYPENHPHPSHKHYEIILAWMSGKEVQFKTPGYDWRDVAGEESYFLSCNEYRIKPEHQKAGE